MLPLTGLGACAHAGHAAVQAFCHWLLGTPSSESPSSIPGNLGWTLQSVPTLCSWGSL